MQTPFGFKIGIHKRHLGQTGGGGVLVYAGVEFYMGFDCFAGPSKGRTEVER